MCSEMPTWRVKVMAGWSSPFCWGFPMLDEMTLSNGSPWLGRLSSSRSVSALMASSPRTAYCTVWKVGLISLVERGAMVIGAVDWNLVIIDLRNGREAAEAAR